MAFNLAELKRFLSKFKWVFRTLLATWIILMFITPVKPPTKSQIDQLNKRRDIKAPKQLSLNKFCKLKLGQLLEEYQTNGLSGASSRPQLTLLTDLPENDYQLKYIKKYFKRIHFVNDSSPSSEVDQNLADQFVNSDVFYFYDRRYPLVGKKPCKSQKSLRLNRF